MYFDQSLIDPQVSPFQVLEHRAADAKNHSIFLGVSPGTALGKVCPYYQDPGPKVKQEQLHTWFLENILANKPRKISWTIRVAESKTVGFAQ